MLHQIEWYDYDDDPAFLEIMSTSKGIRLQVIDHESASAIVHMGVKQAEELLLALDLAIGQVNGEQL